MYYVMVQYCYTILYMQMFLNAFQINGYSFKRVLVRDFSRTFYKVMMFLDLIAY